MTRSIGVVLLLALAHPAFAQVNPAFADVSDEIEMVRSLVRIERKARIANCVGPSDPSRPLIDLEGSR